MGKQPQQSYKSVKKQYECSVPYITLNLYSIYCFSTTHNLQTDARWDCAGSGMPWFYLLCLNVINFTLNHNLRQSNTNLRIKITVQERRDYGTHYFKVPWTCQYHKALLINPHLQGNKGTSNFKGTVCTKNLVFAFLSRSCFCGCVCVRDKAALL